MPVWMTGRQGTNDWLRERAGVLTASRIAAALSFLRNGKESEDRKKLKIALVSERMTGLNTENYVSPAMMFGLENEAAAKERFEEISGELITECGFALHDEIHHLGASPDALVGNDAVLEVKVPTSATFIEWKASGVVPPQHMPQMLCQLAVTKRRFAYFFAFDPRVQYREHQHFLRRFEPSEADISAVEEAARMFLREVDELFDRITREEVA
jgi:predicted phage-related endonuclease